MVHGAEWCWLRTRIMHTQMWVCAENKGKSCETQWEENLWRQGRWESRTNTTIAGRFSAEENRTKCMEIYVYIGDLYRCGAENETRKAARGKPLTELCCAVDVVGFRFWRVISSWPGAGYDTRKHVQKYLSNFSMIDWFLTRSFHVFLMRYFEIFCDFMINLFEARLIFIVLCISFESPKSKNRGNYFHSYMDFSYENVSLFPFCFLFKGSHCIKTDSLNLY